MALALLELGCAGLKPFPAKTVWETDTKFNVCGEYRITDAKRLLFEHVKDWPLSKCDGVFGFAAEDKPRVMNWSRDAIEKCDQTCGCNKICKQESP